jgi:hypothetical protein
MEIDAQRFHCNRQEQAKARKRETDAKLRLSAELIVGLQLEVLEI